MKFNLTLIITLFTLLLSQNMHAQSTSANRKILVVYYSWGGNTRNMATQIKEATGADIFEIVPEQAYPKDYNACVDQAKKEINANFRPPLKSKPADISKYDVVFVGSPNWWSTIAPPVATFLSTYNLSGKTVVPFITHEGSRMGRSVTDIRKLCPNSTILEGLPVRGSYVKDAQDDIREWLRNLKMIK